jgi:hypothetical protein
MYYVINITVRKHNDYIIVVYVTVRLLHMLLRIIGLSIGPSQDRQLLNTALKQRNANFTPTVSEIWT